MSGHRAAEGESTGIGPADFSLTPLTALEATWCLGSLIDEGGQGAIFQHRWDRRLVVKKYHVPKARADLTRVHELIELCASLKPEDRGARLLYETCNLPLRPILGHSANFRGVVLPVLPADVRAIRFTYDPSSGVLKQSTRMGNFQAQHLVNAESVFGYGHRQRQFRILQQLTRSLAAIHSTDLIHGDLSLKNVLVRQRDVNGLHDLVYLIDMDDALIDQGRGVPVVRKSAPMYDPYSIETGRTSKATDVYVAALWVVAFITRRARDATQLKGTLPIDAQEFLLRYGGAWAAELVRKSLGPPSGRPSMAELHYGISLVAESLRVKGAK